MAGEPTRSGEYRQARIGAGLALVFATVLLVLLDAVLPTYEADPIVLGVLLTTGAAMLGVEVVGAVFKRP